MTSYAITEAQLIALRRVKRITACETVALSECGDRILAEAIAASRSLPPFDNAAMDGYAVKCADAGKVVKVTDTIFAGDEPKRAVCEGEAIKIMTGAPTPEGAEAIAMIEHIERVDANTIRLPEKIAPSQHIRRKGEELEAGKTLFTIGDRLTPVRAALLASQGVAQVKVFRRVKVAVISTGDEVVELGGAPNAFQIFNSNATALIHSLRQAGFETIYSGTSRDDPIALAERLKNAFAVADAAITSGGISAGEADFTKRAFESIGSEIYFHGLNFKPGKPTMAGSAFGKPFFALPGNPLSAVVNLRALVLPALRKLQGAKACADDYIYAQNDEAFTLKNDRDTAVLGCVSRGRFTVTRGGKYGSGMLLPLAESDALAIFASSVKTVEKDQIIKVVSLNAAPVADAGDPINR
jgi:molybdopterin molybdotransferase